MNTQLEYLIDFIKLVKIIAKRKSSMHQTFQLIQLKVVADFGRKCLMSLRKPQGLEDVQRSFIYSSDRESLVTKYFLLTTISDF